MAHPGDYWNQKDYMDALNMIFNQQTQGDHFGETRNIGMEPSCGQYKDPTTGEEKYIYQGFVHEIKKTGCQDHLPKHNQNDRNAPKNGWKRNLGERCNSW